MKIISIRALNIHRNIFNIHYFFIEIIKLILNTNLLLRKPLWQRNPYCLPNLGYFHALVVICDHFFELSSNFMNHYLIGIDNNLNLKATHERRELYEP